MNIFHILFSLSLLALLALRTYSGRKARQNRTGVELKEGKFNMAVRAVFGLGYVASLLVYVFAPTWFSWAALPLSDWLRWVGAFITLGSLLLLGWVQWALGNQFDTTLHTQAEHQLIRHGPYRWIRHPMYTALFFIGLGWFLLNANWFAGFPLMIGIFLVVRSRVEKEEQVLIDLFGVEYKDYMKGTGRFLPRLSTKGS